MTDAIDEVAWLRERVEDAATDSLAPRWLSAAQVVADIAPSMLAVIEAVIEVGEERPCSYALHDGPRDVHDPECPGASCYLGSLLSAFRAAVREEMSR